MEQEMFGMVLNDEDLEDELAALDVLIFEEQIPEVSQNIISQADA